MNAIAYIGAEEPIAIFVPDMVLDHAEGYRYEWLRGYAHVLAVFEGETCIGWTLKEHLALMNVLPTIPS